MKKHSIFVSAAALFAASTTFTCCSNDSRIVAKIGQEKISWSTLYRPDPITSIESKRTQAERARRASWHLTDMLWARARQEYATRLGYSPTEQELTEHRKFHMTSWQAEPNAQTRSSYMNNWRADEAKREMIEWHVDKALYEKYGGRIGWDKPGLRPTGARSIFLMMLEKEGVFRIYDDQLRDACFFEVENYGIDMSNELAAKFFSKPEWKSTPEENRIVGELFDRDFWKFKMALERKN
jgi:hypothetical protein